MTSLQTSPFQRADMFRNFSRLSVVFLVITSVVILLSYNHLRLKEYFKIFDLLNLHSDKGRTVAHISGLTMSTTISDMDLAGKNALWLQNRFTALYESVPPPPEEECNMTELVYSAFGKDAEISYNHREVSLQRFQEELEANNFGVAGSTIEWKDLVEMSAKESDPDSEGSIVAGTFVVTLASKFLIRASPAIRLTYNIFSAKIEADKAAQPDADGSRQRITHLFLTSVHKPAPVHMQAIPDPLG